MFFLLILLFSFAPFCFPNKFSSKQECIVNYLLFEINIQTEIFASKKFCRNCWKVQRKIQKEFVKNLKIEKKDLEEYKGINYANDCFKKNKSLVKGGNLLVDKMFGKVNYMSLSDDYQKKLGK
ncbi:unnamed protein product [Meloidogyne enterolobii]|uniref:Uncharacterized protein n=1 Tax=Meloidogyne enterolobii TaxID=390850 RepID=A0ACB1B5G7_MELEN